MKKFLSVLLLLIMVISIIVISAVSASAEVTELPADWNPSAYEYIVVGNEGLLGDYAWQPTNEAFKMNYDETAGIWYLNLKGVANEGKLFSVIEQPYYRVVPVGYNEDNPMELSFTDHGVAQDYRDYTYVNFDPTGEMKAQTITITFDGKKTKTELDLPYVEQSTPANSEYYLTGSAPLFNPAWTPNSAEYKMIKENDNEYSLEITGRKEIWNSNIEYKVTDGTWNVAYNDQGEAVGENSSAKLYIPENTVLIKFTFNSETKCVDAETVVDNNIIKIESPTDKSTETTTDEATAVLAEAPTDATNSTNATTATTTATTATTTATVESTTDIESPTKATNISTSPFIDKGVTATVVTVAIVVVIVVIILVCVVVAKKRKAK